MVNAEKHKNLLNRIKEDNPDLFRKSTIYLINTNAELLAIELEKDLEENIPVLRHLKLLPKGLVKSSGLNNMKDSLLTARTVLEIIENERESLKVDNETLEDLKNVASDFVEVANEILKLQEDHLTKAPTKIKELVESS